MANPQPTDAHLRIAHEISEQLMVSHFTARQRRILDLILRLSWGCGKKEASIPRQRDFEVVGILEGHIQRELEVLERDHVIIRNGNEYSFNKDFDKWRISRARGYNPKKLTELVRWNLNHTYQSGKPDLPNREVGTYQSCKKPLTEMVSPTDTELATPKEILKKDNKKELISMDLIIKKHQEVIGNLDEKRGRELRSYINNFGAEVIYNAIERAGNDGESTWAHVCTIVRASDTRYVKGSKV